MRSGGCVMGPGFPRGDGCAGRGKGGGPGHSPRPLRPVPVDRDGRVPHRRANTVDPEVRGSGSRPQTRHRGRPPRLFVSHWNPRPTCSVGAPVARPVPLATDIGYYGDKGKEWALFKTVKGNRGGMGAPRGRGRPPLHGTRVLAGSTFHSTSGRPRGPSLGMGNLETCRGDMLRQFSIAGAARCDVSATLATFSGTGRELERRTGRERLWQERGVAARTRSQNS